MDFYGSLPSWVPYYGYFNFLCSYQDPIFAASRGCEPLEFVVFRDEKMLSIEGQQFDYLESLRDLLSEKIEELSPGWAWQDGIYSRLWQSLPSHQECMDELGLLHGVYADEVWRVLLSDCSSATQRLRPSELEEYRKYYRDWYDTILDRLQRKNDNSILGRMWGHLRERYKLMKHAVIIEGDIRYASFPPTAFTQALQRFSLNRRLAITRGKRLVSVPWNAEVGDEIAVLQSASVPCLLRKYHASKDGAAKAMGVTDRVEMVGSVYVHGLMDGEVVRDMRRFPARTYNVI